MQKNEPKKKSVTNNIQPVRSFIVLYWAFAQSKLGYKRKKTGSHKKAIHKLMQMAQFIKKVQP
jgi:hypothetical protein